MKLPPIANHATALRRFLHRRSQWSGRLGLLGILCLPLFATAGQPDVPPIAKTRTQQFRQVARLLQVHCVRCHTGEEPFGGLRMDTLAALRQGGDSGPAVDLEQPADSLLMQRIEEGSMPPINDGEPLSKPQAQQIQRWLADGAYWPDGARLVAIEGDETESARAIPPTRSLPLPSCTPCSAVRSTRNALGTGSRSGHRKGRWTVRNRARCQPATRRRNGQPRATRK